MNKINLYKWGSLFLLLTACTGSSQQPDSEQTSRQLDSLFDFYGQHDLYFVSVALEKGGEPLYRRVTGYEVLENKKELDPQSVFLIGSITKTYTAVMIMQLAEKGKISLQDKLSRFYPEIPNAGKIDIEMLLRHRSGLFNFTSAEEFLSEVGNPVSREALLDRFRKLDIVFSPGTRFEYSNTNYVLLGFILEDLTGDSYEHLLQTRILDRLGLTHTYYGRPDDRAHFARSYQFRNGEWVPVPEWNTGWALGAGAIAATRDDVSAFYKGLFEGKLVSEESLKQMTDLKDNYGLGLTGVPYGNRTFYGHGGGIEQYRTISAYYPEDSLLFTQMSNGAFDGNTNEVSILLLNAVYGNPVSFPDTSEKVTANVPLSVLSAYEGMYAAPDFPLDIRIFVRDSLLFGQASGQPAFPLNTRSDTRFTQPAAAISLDFFLEDGIQKFHFKQGTVEREFSRRP